MRGRKDLITHRTEVIGLESRRRHDHAQTADNRAVAGKQRHRNAGNIQQPPIFVPGVTVGTDRTQFRTQLRS